MRNAKCNIKNILSSISNGLIVYQSDEDHGLSGLCHILNYLPNDRKLYGIFESIKAESFNNIESSQVVLSRGIFYHKLIRSLKLTEYQFIIIENPRDKETLSLIFELIERSHCAVLIWLRGPGQETSYVQNLLRDLGFEDKYFLEIVKCVIYQDFSLKLN